METRKELISDLVRDIKTILYCIGLLVIFFVMVISLACLFGLVFSVELSLMFGMLLTIFCMIYGENIIACIEEVLDLFRKRNERRKLWKLKRR